MLVCSKCGQEKNKTFFYIRKETGKPRKECKSCFNESTSKWQAANREKVKSYVRKSCKKAYDADPEKFRKKSREKRAKNPQLAREIVNKSYKKIYYSRWEQERARLNNLSAQKRTATPSWLSAIEKAQIQEIYDVARAKTMQTGVQHHVDHIMPVNGEVSCGLHVPWNLQILTAAENCGKKNKVVEI